MNRFNSFAFSFAAWEKPQELSYNPTKCKTYDASAIVGVLKLNPE